MKKRVWVYFGIVLVVLVVLVVTWVVYNHKNQTLTQDQVFEVIQPYMKADCDYLLEYDFSLVYGNCPYCKDPSLSSFLKGPVKEPFFKIEKVGKYFYVSTQTEINYGRNTYSGVLIYNFTLDKKGEIVDKALPDMEEYGCYNLDPNTSEGKCYYAYQNWSNILNSFRSISCEKDSDCMLVDSSYLISACNYCLFIGDISELSYLKELRDEYYEEDCSDVSVCTDSAPSCYCNSENSCSAFYN